MTAINKELYDALIEGGTTEAKASAAAATIRPAEDLATKADIAALRAEIYKVIAAQTALLLLAAMVGLKLFG